MSDTITATIDIELDVDEMDAALSRIKTVTAGVSNDVETEITGLNRNK